MICKYLRCEELHFFDLFKIIIIGIGSGDCLFFSNIMFASKTAYLLVGGHIPHGDVAQMGADGDLIAALVPRHRRHRIRVRTEVAQSRYLPRMKRVYKKPHRYQHNRNKTQFQRPFYETRVKNYETAVHSDKTYLWPPPKQYILT